MSRNHQGKPTPRLYESAGWRVRTYRENFLAGANALQGVNYFPTVVVGQSANVGALSVGSNALQAVDYFSVVVVGAATVGAFSAAPSMSAADYFLVVVLGQPASVGALQAGGNSLAAANYFQAITPGTPANVGQIENKTALQTVDYALA